MLQQHPITPSDELVQEWTEEHRAIVDGSMYVEDYIAAQTARYRQIADAELEACCEWLREARHHGLGYEVGAMLADRLRDAMRPKPLSLVRRALHILGTHGDLSPKEHDTIRQALEHLDG